MARAIQNLAASHKSLNGFPFDPNLIAYIFTCVRAIKESMPSFADGVDYEHKLSIDVMSVADLRDWLQLDHLPRGEWAISFTDKRDDARGFAVAIHLGNSGATPVQFFGKRPSDFDLHKWRNELEALRNELQLQLEAPGDIALDGLHRRVRFDA